jgi:hypothetical protein
MTIERIDPVTPENGMTHMSRRFAPVLRRA